MLVNRPLNVSPCISFIVLTLWSLNCCNLHNPYRRSHNVRNYSPLVEKAPPSAPISLPDRSQQLLLVSFLIRVSKLEFVRLKRQMDLPMRNVIDIPDRILIWNDAFNI
ncbi:hypothetical protein XELAEV_18017797mg [Xenopus laevis]|uniref:Uncharacterized protein n=1 Tax=Xenopus laevis TaxID=8355 RepID=A0A974HT13_XENLA|nr:hypothetical protein XELAEV_18017797mg [Xenopus laevis]